MAITKLTVYPAVEVVNITIFYSGKSLTVHVVAQVSPQLYIDELASGS